MMEGCWTASVVTEEEEEEEEAITWNALKLQISTQSHNGVHIAWAMTRVH